MRTSHSRFQLTARRSTFLTAAVALVAGGAAIASSLAPAAGAPRIRTASPARAAASRGVVKPGRIGAPITLAKNISFDGDIQSYEMATDKAGVTYIAWIATDNLKHASGLHHIHLCVIPKATRKCAGGIKNLDPIADANAAGLQLLVSPAGQATILWYADVAGTSHIYDTTATKTGPLSKESSVGTGPTNGYMLAAGFAPNGSIWTVTTGGSGPLTVQEGLQPGAKKVTVKAPSYSHTHGALAFSGKTPIIVLTDDSDLSKPVQYSHATAAGTGWTSFKGAPNTRGQAGPVGLIRTPSGVRLSAMVASASYLTTVSRWTGHGFSRAKLIGGNLSLSGHNVSTDRSGRLADVGNYSGGEIIVVNLPDTTHEASFNFKIASSQTLAGGNPAITTTPRGRGWVAWSYYNGDGANGDVLRLSQFVLAGLHTRKTVHGHHGSATLTGPASCLPPVSISVSVAGHPDKGWKVTARRVTLGGKKVGGSLNGAGLTAGKVYSLAGTVTFSKGHSHSKVKSVVKFRSCPN
jgi:hypothetical protein